MVRSLKYWEGRKTILTLEDGTIYNGSIKYGGVGNYSVYNFETVKGKLIPVSGNGVHRLTANEGGLVRKVGYNKTRSQVLQEKV
ncbi:MAG TPA: hypothetical protein VJI68_02130 [Candidatus Nanoarchaeia archaeon]|nr:hypothetical protein [Candidatus Nanoarchaeia archaeon]